MRKFILLLTWFLLLLTKQVASQSQRFMRHMYYDSAQKNIKMSYQVKDTVDNTANGEYTSYFLNGNVQSTGYFSNNQPVGDWDFFYETGEMKMQNFTIKDSVGYTFRVYYHKNGQKSADGYMNKENREGVWKLYFEDGILQNEIEYDGDINKYTEYYRSGEVQSKGQRKGGNSVGYWHFFYRNGTVSEEGNYKDGKKNGLWKYYHPSGSISLMGTYKTDQQTGIWTHLFKNGKINSRGEYADGKKEGQWDTFDINGGVQSRGFFKQGLGKLVQYYPNGKIKATGRIEDNKKHGNWDYFYKDGSKKGKCDFDMGSGIYYGYHKDGTIQTKGRIENTQQIGSWEIYDQEGTLTGYYKPFYKDSRKPVAEPDEEKKAPKNASATVEEPSLKPSGKKNSYFTARFPEYRGIIIQGNPFFTFIGMLPISLEFYAQNRLGYEFLFEIIRQPFFEANDEITKNKIFNRGYDIAIKQKFYHPINRLGMWYFGHQILFTSLTHSANMLLSPSGASTVAQASETRAEYGPLLGIRFMWGTGRNGFTIDADIGLVIGYRNFATIAMYEDIFSSLNKEPFSYTFRFGINFGYVLSSNN